MKNTNLVACWNLREVRLKSPQVSHHARQNLPKITNGGATAVVFDHGYAIQDGNQQDGN